MLFDQGFVTQLKENVLRILFLFRFKDIYLKQNKKCLKKIVTSDFAKR